MVSRAQFSAEDHNELSNSLQEKTNQLSKLESAFKSKGLDERPAVRIERVEPGPTNNNSPGGSVRVSAMQGDEDEDNGSGGNVGTIVFGINKADLDETSKLFLSELVMVVTTLYPDMQITVSGHTDATGTDEYNQQLSLRRANAVKAFLISKGISKQQIKVIGFGEDNPIADNSTDIGKAMNRRVELDFY
jgi:outer membrane protein OmpA-like peptidoglycan-associated protein